MKLPKSFKFKLSPPLEKLCGIHEYLATVTDNPGKYKVTWVESVAMHCENFGYFEVRYSIDGGQWVIQ